ncbi:probable calcium-binding protein CML18 [Elaeis guineensis]|uniref:Probable calcium-binding protein CML18 n=1 Tax=Elaeis guineensis var. tenera TaxID=51953 RepID=A0A6I9QWN0_ELAGV|nr:probable calcium-binding protein CML18 [Elaeis guineensis]
MAEPQESKKTPELVSMNDVERVFMRYDANGDGKISASELAEVMRALRSEVSDEELKAMMAELDTDGDGFVDLKEFAAFHCGLGGAARGGGGEGELRDAFEMYDLDKNGLISAKELHLVLKRLGEKCSVQDCSRMIRSVDSDGDGSVNFEEFKEMMVNGERKKASDGDPSPLPSPSSN